MEIGPQETSAAEIGALQPGMMKQRVIQPRLTERRRPPVRAAEHGHVELGCVEAAARDDRLLKDCVAEHGPAAVWPQQERPICCV